MGNSVGKPLNVWKSVPAVTLTEGVRDGRGLLLGASFGPGRPRAMATSY